jgi:hypothetical protein
MVVIEKQSQNGNPAQPGISSLCVISSQEIGGELPTKARRNPVLGAATSCLVFQSQSDVCQHLDFTSTGGHQ